MNPRLGPANTYGFISVNGNFAFNRASISITLALFDAVPSAPEYELPLVMNLRPGAIEKLGVIGASNTAPIMNPVFEPNDVDGVWLVFAMFNPASKPKDNFDCECTVRVDATMNIPSIIALNFIVFSF